ncbi:MAG: manganese efflux pump MntP family protein [Pseudonocardiaceae bacterium]
MTAAPSMVFSIGFGSSRTPFVDRHHRRIFLADRDSSSGVPGERNEDDRTSIDDTRNSVVYPVNSGFLSFLLSVLPLGMDTFAIAAVVGGTSQLTGRVLWRISVVFVLFEGGMPLVGLALGESLGHTIGGIADYLSGGLLIALAGYLWRAENKDDDDDEVTKARCLSSARGLALLGVALSISLDELAIGFSLGLGFHQGPHLTRPATIVAAIAVQTLIVSQLGLSLGSRVSERFRERIERLTSPGLACLGGYQLTGALVHTGLGTTLGTVALAGLVGGTVILILATVTIARRSTQRGAPPAAQPGAQHLTPAATATRLNNPASTAPSLPRPGRPNQGTGVIGYTIH